MVEDAAGIDDDDMWVAEMRKGGRFLIKRSDAEDRIVRKLKVLRKENFHNEVDFIIDSISWTERIRHEMILTFQHYNDLGRQWNEAIIVCLWEPETSVHIGLVFQSPVTIQLFRSLKFNSDPTQVRPMEIQLASIIAFVLRNGREVSIDGFEIQQDAMSILSDSLVTLPVNVALQELEFCHVNFSNNGASSETRSAEQCLADGLARNRTLTSIAFWNCLLNAALMVQSLIGHPFLKKIELTEVEIREATTSAICSLMASPTCNLLDLELSSHFLITTGSYVFDFAGFTEQLPVNTSLQKLKLSSFVQCIDQDSANQLLRSLWKLPSLKCLDLSGNTIRDLVRLAENVTMATPHSRLRELDLHGNDFDFGGQSTSDEHSTRAILHLLDVFPELGYLGPNVAEKFPVSVAARMDVNRFSRIFLRGAEIPLPVWSVVLAEVNSDTGTTSRQANVIYKMLHGPAFAGRGRFD